MQLFAVALLHDVAYWHVVCCGVVYSGELLHQGVNVLPELCSAVTM